MMTTAKSCGIKSPDLTDFVDCWLQCFHLVDSFAHLFETKKGQLELV